MEIEDDMPEQQLIGLDSLLEILGNPTRRSILSKLAKVPHTGPEIADDLGISRQAIHSQLKLLTDSGLIEGPPEGSRGGTFRIRSNISVRIEITPQYYNIKFTTNPAFNDSNATEFQDMNCSINYSKIKTVDDKIKFLGDQILKVEQDISHLDQERKEFLIRKQCILQEIRKLMQGQYKTNLEKRLKVRYNSIKDKSLNDLFNLSEEIVFTMFYNPQRYKNRVDINKLLDDLFFSDMDSYQRDQRFGSIRSLLTDMSSLMGFLREDDEDWFFDF
ncbi:MAG: helix-turn-helix domain-containing protein [Candidatus Lokiarchaeota archaeon]|nr:helix-turn-helix domain-containing protein [Candidatus Lokiarchaeota archaeon]